ncbi:DUF2065 domain-containing protein [Thalassotalea agariperforans]
MMTTLLMAIAIAFIIEGLIPALFPNKWQAYVAKLANEPTAQVRTMGLIVMIIGLLLLWVVSP